MIGNKISKKVFLFIAVFFVCLPPFLYSFFNTTKFSDVDFWWAILNPKISNVLGGSKLECREVKWCGAFKICANNCENQDESFIVNALSVRALTGEVKVNQWSFLTLPKNFSKRKAFPKIPLPIVSITLENGDLSSIIPQIPKISYIQLNRISPFGQSWYVKGNSIKNKISFYGNTGDSSNINVLIKNFFLDLNNIKTTVNGNLLIQNNSFRSSPVKFILSDFELSNNKVNNILFPDSILNLSIVFQDEFKKILEVKNLNLIIGKVNPIHIHTYKTNNFDSFFFRSNETVNLLVDSFSVEILNKYLKDLKTIKILKNINLEKLSGWANAQISLNLQNYKKSELLIYLKSFGCWLSGFSGNTSYLGSLTGSIKLSPLRILNADLKTDEKVDLRALGSLYENEFLKMKTGYLNTSIIYDYSKKYLNGEILISNLGLFHSLSNLELMNGNGKFFIKENKLQGDLKALFKDKQEFLNANFNINLLPVISGKININVPKLTLPEIEAQNKSYKLKGLISNVKVSADILNSKIVAVSGDALINEINLLMKTFINKSIKFQEGNLQIEKNILKLNKLKATLSNDDSAQIEGFVSLDNNFATNFENSKFSIKGKTLLKTLLEILASLNQPNTNKIFQEIKEPTGSLTSDFLIVNQQITDLKISLDNAGLIYKTLKFKSPTGLIRIINSKKCKFEEVILNFGDNSKLILNGSVLLNAELERLNRLKNLTNVISSYEGQVRGNLNLSDLLSKKTIDRYGISIPEDVNFPIVLSVNPLSRGTVAFDFESNLASLGSIYSPWITAQDNTLSKYIIAKGLYNLQTNYFQLNQLESSINGANISAIATGFPTNFDFKAYTDPLLNFDKLFKTTNGLELHGALTGWIEGRKLNIFDKESIWKNLRFSLKTDENESISIGEAELNSFETYFESKNGKGFSTIVIDSGKIKNLPFQDINSSLSLEGSNLKIPGLSLKTAGGDFSLKGQLNLNNAYGTFNGNAKKLDVGRLAKGLTGQQGFSGVGDFNFIIDGHLISLIKGNKPVAATGSFNLRNGHASQVLNLQKKLNVANLVFAGPLGLNMNSILEVLDPTDNGYYQALYGNWKLTEHSLEIPEVHYRGVSELTLNIAGNLNRTDNILKANVVGSIPKVPVRVTSSGQRSEFLNLFSQLNVSNVLGQLPFFNTVIDARPRVFKFNMKGNISNERELNTTASNSFVFLDSALYKSLPKPKLPENN